MTKRSPLPDKTTECVECGTTKSTKTEFYLREDGRLAACRCRVCVLARQKKQVAQRKAAKENGKATGTRAPRGSLMARMNVERRELYSMQVKVDRRLRALDAAIKALRATEGVTQ